jgi:hypothetical protein
LRVCVCVTGFEIRALLLLGRRLPLEPFHQPSCLGCFSDRVFLYTPVSFDRDLPVHTSLCSWDDSVCYCAQPLVEMGFDELFAQAGLEL